MSTSRRTFTRHRTLIGATTGLVAGLGLGLGLSVAGSPPASASPLPLFGGCEELRQWYVDRALPLVGPYGLGGGVVAYGGAMEDAGSVAPGEPGAPVPVAGQARVTQEVGQTASGTGTNVQESDVDEPDLAKTDGSLVVRLVGGRLLVSRVGDGQVGRVGDAGTLELPAGLQASELLLSGTRVLVVGSSYLGGGPAPQPLSVPDGPTSVEPPVARALPFAPYPLEDSSRLVEVDLTDVHGHPGTQRSRARPRLTLHRPLQVDGGRERVRCPGEGGDRAVPGALLGGTTAVPSRAGLADDREMAREVDALVDEAAEGVYPVFLQGHPELQRPEAARGLEAPVVEPFP